MAEVLAAKEVVDIAEKANKAVSNAIDVYNKMVDQVIPWATFDGIISNLKGNKDQYSAAAAVIVGEVQKLLMDSKDNYDSSTGAVYRWCQSAVPLLQGFMALFESISDPEAAKAQLLLFKDTLNMGQLAMELAINELENSKKSFNEAAGKLTTLNAQLKLDFSVGSNYFKAAVTKLRTEAYAGAVSGVVLGPIGLAISYSIAAGVVEGQMIPNLEKAFKKTKASFKNMETMLTDAQTDITQAKEKLSFEVKVVGTILARIKTTDALARGWYFAPSTMFGMLKDSTNKLVAMCEAYVKSKDDKKA